MFSCSCMMPSSRRIRALARGTRTVHAWTTLRLMKSATSPRGSIPYSAAEIRDRPPTIEATAIRDEFWPLLLERLPHHPIRTLWMGICPGAGDASLHQPGVQFVVALRPQPRGEEALAHRPDLVHDLTLLPRPRPPRSARRAPGSRSGRRAGRRPSRSPLSIRPAVRSASWSPTKWCAPSRRRIPTFCG